MTSPARIAQLEQLLDFGDELKAELERTPKWRILRRMTIRSAFIHNASLIQHLGGSGLIPANRGGTRMDTWSDVG